MWLPQMYTECALEGTLELYVESLRGGDLDGSPIE